MLSSIFYTIIAVTLVAGLVVIYLVWRANQKGVVRLHIPEREWLVGEVIDGQIEIIAKRPFAITRLSLAVLVPAPASRAGEIRSSATTLINKVLVEGISLVPGADLTLDFQLEIPPLAATGSSGLLKAISGARSSRTLELEALAETDGLNLVRNIDFTVRMPDVS